MKMDGFFGMIILLLFAWGAYSVVGMIYPFRPFRIRTNALKSLGATFGAFMAVVLVGVMMTPITVVEKVVTEVPLSATTVVTEVEKTGPENQAASDESVVVATIADSEQTKKLNDWIDRYALTMAHDPQRRQTCRAFVEEYKLEMPNLCLDSNVAKGSFGSAGRVISTATMASFSDCKSNIVSAAAKIGSSPVVIVDTDIMKMVRFRTNDGSGESVLVTCSAPDRKMVITISG